MTKILNKIWDITGSKRDSFDDSENYFFDPIGLILLKKLECWGYWCTPTNTISFATTGGDGVHFGFLCANDGKPSDDSPIVMTLPSADTSNIIVGENFKEFLNLACRIGFFELEQIEYQPEIYLPLLDSHKYIEDISQEEKSMLENLEKTFKLKPWLNHGSRLIELKDKYFNKLKYSDEYYEIMA